MELESDCRVPNGSAIMRVLVPLAAGFEEIEAVTIMLSRGAGSSLSLTALVGAM